jgi:acetylornithine/succinyldiaminopimelate/putrescine aminotransferase
MKMDMLDRLSKVYDITGVRVHQYRENGFGGHCFGSITVYHSEKKVSGFELVESIRIAKNHIDAIQQAVDNMTQILEGDE